LGFVAVYYALMLEEFGALGGLFGLFFLIQAYGYAVGGRVKRPDGAKMASAVLEGAKHLSHILFPISRRAWPLGPVACGCLLLYAVYLPGQLRAPFDEPAYSLHYHEVNRWFFSMVAAVSLTTIPAFVSMDWTLKVISYLPAGAKYIFSPCYFILMAASTLAFHRFLPELLILSEKPWSNQPWPEINAALIIAWLFFLTFLGSTFDGALDRAYGVADT
jgi:hypothetical protein